MELRFDRITQKRIKKIHPRLMDELYQTCLLCYKDGIPLRITWTLRTDEQQDDLYEIGRTRPGPIITVNRGGHSYHQYGLAFDFCLFDPKTDRNYDWPELTDKQRENWDLVIYKFQEKGWDSGKYFKFCTPNHLQKPHGYEILSLMQLRTTGQLYPLEYPQL